MSDGEQVKYVILHETLWHAIVADVVSFVTIAALISLGVALSSAAMQWFGFLVAACIIFSRAAGKSVKRTPQEVADYLHDEFGVTAAVRREAGVK